MRLAGLDSYYITDETSSVPISWELSNFGDESTQGERAFELKITRAGEEVVSRTSPGAFANGVWRGSVNLPVRTVPMTKEDPNSFWDVYTVTVRAMAGQDNTWSSDSFLL